MRNDLILNATQAEKVAFANIRKLGYDVIFQKPIYTGRRLYFADIYIPKLNLIVEIDGGYHYTLKQKNKDKNRSSGIWRLGYHVVRLCNRDAKNIVKIAGKIKMIEKKTKNKSCH